MRAVYFVVEPNTAQLDQLAGLVVSGHLVAPEMHAVALEEATGIFDEAGYAPASIKTVLVVG